MLTNAVSASWGSREGESRQLLKFNTHNLPTPSGHSKCLCCISDADRDRGSYCSLALQRFLARAPAAAESNFAANIIYILSDDMGFSRHRLFTAAEIESPPVLDFARTTTDFVSLKFYNTARCLSDAGELLRRGL